MALANSLVAGGVLLGLVVASLSSSSPAAIAIVDGTAAPSSSAVEDPAPSSAAVVDRRLPPPLPRRSPTWIVVALAGMGGVAGGVLLGLAVAALSSPAAGIAEDDGGRPSPKMTGPPAGDLDAMGGELPLISHPVTHSPRRPMALVADLRRHRYFIPNREPAFLD